MSIVFFLIIIIHYFIELSIVNVENIANILIIHDLLN